MKKIYLIIVLILIPFLWFEVRPSIIRSKCQAKYDSTFQELHNSISEFRIKTELRPEEFQKVTKMLKVKNIEANLLKRIGATQFKQLDKRLAVTPESQNYAQLVREGSVKTLQSSDSVALITNWRIKEGLDQPDNPDFFTYSISRKGWEEVPQEYKNDFEVMKVPIEKENIFREVAEKEYQGCLRGWGITR